MMKRNLLCSVVLSCLWAVQAQAADGLQRIEHIIIISLENHSFDNLFGHFPGAEGLAQAGKAAIQADKQGTPYKTLPPVLDTHAYLLKRDLRFPADLPNRPFLIDQYVSPQEKTGDLVHRFYQQQEQINSGKMDRFAAVSDAGGLTMGYYDGSRTRLWEYAKRYTLADRFFHAAFGGSFLNHMWMICACTPKYDDAPRGLKITLNRDGSLAEDGAVTPDGYVVNTLFAAEGVHPPYANKDHFLPPQDMPTIGDRLSEKGVSWAWYAGGWDDAVAGRAHKSFQYHHQPFTYFRAYGKDSTHLKDETDFLRALKDGSLPAVAFYKPLGEFNLHPGYADVTSGDAHIGRILEAIEHSPVWDATVVIVTFDENGGYWDHVPPPKVDRWGPGMRVPTMIISPFAKRGHVDHTVYDTTSILKLIEKRFDLAPLGMRDAQAADLSAAFDFK